MVRVPSNSVFIIFICSDSLIEQAHLGLLEFGHFSRKTFQLCISTDSSWLLQFMLEMR